MRYQSKTWSCGPSAVINGARALGIKIPELVVRRACKTTKLQGTDEFGLIHGLKELKYTVLEYTSKSKKEAVNWLTGSLMNTQPVILCVDSWSHWVVVIGKIGHRFILIDSTKTIQNVKENGVHVLTPKQLMRRWVSKEGIIYGIAMGRAGTAK